MRRGRTPDAVRLWGLRELLDMRESSLLAMRALDVTIAMISEQLEGPRASSRPDVARDRFCPAISYSRMCGHR